MNIVREITFLTVSLALAGCQPSTNQSPSPKTRTDTTQVSKSATNANTGAAASALTDAEILDSAEACAHLAGEFGGDQSERDEEVTAEQDSLKCDQALGNLKALKARLPKDSPLLARVNDALGVIE